MAEDKKNSKDSEKAKVNLFEKEIARLPADLKQKLLDKEKVFSKVVDIAIKKAEKKVIGFYLSPEFEMKNGMPTPNFDKLSLNFLLDDFEKPIPFFDVKLLFGDDFDKYLIEEKKKDKYGQQYSVYFLKGDKNIEFFGSSISMLRENCFDSIYDDLKKLGSSFIYVDERGFISALKTIDIHRNMLLQKFEKYVVVYAGAGSWLRGEKSNDFDVFVVIDDTDVKRMSRLQVKDQLTKIIWQMSREVAALTGIQIHIQVYLLTDFWDALKDAHPVMFTFLRDGVPFYDRGIYSAWKELLKLGKIRPSAEAIDMHMNVGTQLIDRAKKMFADIVINEVYNSVLSPSQAILMLKGYNPTTPKETVKMFKEVLLAKEKCVSKKDVDILEETVGMFKKIEHDKDLVVSGSDVDRLLKNAETYLKNIKKMFEEISEDRTKESIVSSYNELINQLRQFPGFNEASEDNIFNEFEAEYLKTGKFPSFVKGSLKNIVKAKSDYDAGKITVTEVNKILKEMRNVMAEIKNYRDRSLMSEVNKKRLYFKYADKKSAELLNFDGSTYLIDFADDKVFVLKGDKFTLSDNTKEDLGDTSKIVSLELSGELIEAAKKILKTEKFEM